jgi:DNA-binding response OmpR family regulator
MHGIQRPLAPFARKPLVLIIEDEAYLAKMMQRLLRSEGFDVEWCELGREGVEKSRSLRPDAIVLDLCLTDVDGFKALHELKFSDKTRDIPIVIASAATHRLTPEERLLAHAIVSKPFSFAQLLDALTSATSHGPASEILPEAPSRLRA